MKNIKTEWLYYIDKYKYVLDKSKNQDINYIKMAPDKIAFVEYLKECSLKELITIMVSIYIDKYPTESRIIFGRLKVEAYREFDDIKPITYEIDSLFNLISYTITFKKEQQETLAIIQNVLSDKDVRIDTQDDQTIFTVANSPIKELIVSSKRMTLHVNEDSIDIALAQQDF